MWITYTYTIQGFVKGMMDNPFRAILCKKLKSSLIYENINVGIYDVLLNENTVYKYLIMVTVFEKQRFYYYINKHLQK